MDTESLQRLTRPLVEALASYGGAHVETVQMPRQFAFSVDVALEDTDRFAEIVKRMLGTLRTYSSAPPLALHVLVWVEASAGAAELDQGSWNFIFWRSQENARADTWREAVKGLRETLESEGLAVPATREHGTAAFTSPFDVELCREVEPLMQALVDRFHDDFSLGGYGLLPARAAYAIRVDPAHGERFEHAVERLLLSNREFGWEAPLVFLVQRWATLQETGEGLDLRDWRFIFEANPRVPQDDDALRLQIEGMQAALALLQVSR